MADHVELVDGLTCLWLKVTGDGRSIYINTDKIISVGELEGIPKKTRIRTATITCAVHLPISEVMQVLLPGDDDDGQGCFVFEKVVE